MRVAAASVYAVRHIHTTRKLKTDGCIVRSVYPQYIESVFPYLGLGVLPGRK